MSGGWPACSQRQPRICQYETTSCLCAGRRQRDLLLQARLPGAPVRARVSGVNNDKKAPVLTDQELSCSSGALIEFPDFTALSAVLQLVG
jgi:hypothetical protein